uniref:EamA domain-containing protein n=1 Tax=Rhizophagus irregularis (strain DAOM 181602 / DAOM 197198 / MUCL 43194) TaxID=747089 RepID=U9SJ68_RHIID
MYFTERHRYAIGILTLLCVVFIWVGSSFLMNNIFANQKYNKPFIITYTCTASFSLYLLYFICNKKRHIDKQSERSLNSNDGMNVNNHPHIDPHDVLSSMHDEEKLTTRQVAELGFTFCILWFAANWSTNASIAYTSVASSTILSSTSGLFTLIIGSLFGVEKFTLIKLAAVLISIFGVFLISNGDEFSSDEPGDDIPTNPLFGNLLALMGAFFYGCYTILLKLRIQNESHVNMPLFFGFVGIFNVILLSPIFPLLHFTGLEQFELPPNITIWTMIAINALIGTFLSDYLWLLAVLLTSPLTATLGLSLTIPIALIGDIFFKGLVMSKEYWLGVFMIVGGFLCVNF